ncbi:MAG: carbohydrate binding family 9 domain-containing protein, partial [Thermoanaerobaculales bacterium]|nr:carbohydrate binding family 9 domain-containing protein [Thermoanaerobaculales bacterium]
MRRGTAAATALLLIVALAATYGAYAQDVSAPKEPHFVPLATSEVTIDGVIDEQAWQDALTLELDYEVRPGENIEPPVRTVVFLTYDEDHVLVAFRAYDHEPAKIRARFRDHDQIRGDDWVGIMLDTFNDERRAYEFWVSPLGVQTEGIYTEGRIEGGRNFDDSWDAIWFSAGRLTDFGYEVELAIPFNQIRFQGTGGPQIWGIDAIRSWPRSDRHHIGLFPRERGANSYLAQEDKLIGFAGASPGRNLELVPTLTGYALEERPDFPPSTEVEEDSNIELGATVTWGMTPNITLTGALNPDFSQIEADAVQLAINQTFELFFEERRPFFLESADYFETGVPLLYTRMIGDPLAAAKITGKMGRHTIGVISAYDEVTNLIAPGAEGSDSDTFESPNAAFVGRYRYDLGSDSTVGAFVSDRRGSDGYFNRVFSGDAMLRPTEADSITINAALSTTQYSEEMQSALDLTSEEIAGHGFEIEYVHTARDWFGFAEYTDLGDDFRADLGFIPRVGFREAAAGAGYLWWGEDDNWYNRLEVGGFLGRSTNQQGDLLNQTTQIWFQGEGPLQ